MRSITLFSFLLSIVAAQQDRPSSERGYGITMGGIGGSIPSGKATAEVMDLSIKDTIERALKYNLALNENGEDERLKRAQRLLTLSRLLPQVSIRPSAVEQQVSLAAFGFAGYGGFPSVIGPFGVVDLRANVTQTLLDLRQRRTLKADKENEATAAFQSADLRGKVAVYSSGLYLQALAAQARVETQQTQVKTAERVLEQANGRHNAGTVPKIDVLRAQVQLDQEQNHLFAYEGEFTKRLIDLGRAIGLPPGQKIRLTDSMPAEPLPSDVTFEATLEQAYTQRADYKAVQSSVKAAEFSRSAALADRYPTADAQANYGVIGPSVTSLHGTFSVGVGMTIPLYGGGHSKYDLEAADTVVRRRKAELEDLRAKIDAEVRNAFTDLRTAARQVEVSQRSIELAKEQLTEAQDRFSAGVANSLETVQSQQAVAAANEAYIAALYSLNVARATFLLARGDAEQTIQEFLRRSK